MPKKGSDLTSYFKNMPTPRVCTLTRPSDPAIFRIYQFRIFTPHVLVLILLFCSVENQVSLT